MVVYSEWGACQDRVLWLGGCPKSVWLWVGDRGSLLNRILVYWVLIPDLKLWVLWGFSSYARQFWCNKLHEEEHLNFSKEQTNHLDPLVFKLKHTTAQQF